MAVLTSRRRLLRNDVQRRGDRPPARTGVAVAVVLGTVGIGVLAGAAAPASAFDCQKAAICEYVKVSNADKKNVDYNVTGSLYSAKDPDHPYQTWSEKDPTFTLWHWRAHDVDHSLDLKVKIHVEAQRDGKQLQSLDQEFSAYQSTCIKVDNLGAYVSAGCSDFDDPRENKA